ncbi:NAD(P)-binding domain-containing protein [Fictibacillus sp. 5RED26]|uniref:flavin-containing monooxygenase n=1 Tax=Fictibacillus sp. 5RED26 TaxID=2745876 RepID=UPI0018CDDF0B|nr:NAD(P)/FAD-dependent oxidoreductase [Fictibacillus sp. 5RED26]MBH0157321.1 NAD(P)-binding domain-containing protein [Fictibacillus sp. 5RED26]
MYYDVIIIGGGQAGLCMGYYLQGSNLSFIILEAAVEVGSAWRNRYDSLKLFTPRYFSSLPGLNLSGNPNDYPTKDEIADYLSLYAKTFSLPIQTNCSVKSLTTYEEGFKVTTTKGELTAGKVVVATGPFQSPLVPNISRSLSDVALQLHSSTYKNPKQLQEGSVLVVGGGNSGAQIAVELSKEREVTLSIGHKLKFLPQDIGKKSIFWYFNKFGIYSASYKSIRGAFVKNQPDPIFGMELKKRINTGQIKLKPRTVSGVNDTITFEDNSSLRVNNIVWSTGFKMDYSWIKISEAFNPKGMPLHERGISPINGLYFLGLPWQYSRGSGLVAGVGPDANYLFHKMNNQSIIKKKTF